MTLKARAPKALYLSSSPMVIDGSPALDTMRMLKDSATVGQRQTDLFQQQQFQTRKQAASGKGSNLGLAVELNLQGNDSVESSGPSGSAGYKAEHSTGASGGPRRSLRQTEAKRKSHEKVAGSSHNANNSGNSKQKRPRDVSS
jgi:hypothetical protein